METLEFLNFNTTYKLSYICNNFFCGIVVMVMNIENFFKAGCRVSTALVLIASLGGGAFALPGFGEESTTSEKSKSPKPSRLRTDRNSEVKDLVDIEASLKEPNKLGIQKELEEKEVQEVESRKSPISGNVSGSESEEDWDADFGIEEVARPELSEEKKFSEDYLRKKFYNSSKDSQITEEKQLESEEWTEEKQLKSKDWLTRNMTRIEIAKRGQEVVAEELLKKAVQEEYPEALMLRAEQKAQEGAEKEAVHFYQRALESLLLNRREFLEVNAEQEEKECTTFCRLKGMAKGLGKRLAMFKPVYKDKKYEMLFPQKERKIQPSMSQEVQKLLNGFREKATVFEEGLEGFKD